MAKLVSQVYAEALFGLGVENGLLDTLLEELNGMCEILGKNPQFVTLLGHPELDQKEKTAVFDRVFDGEISKELNGFCHLLLEKGRFGELFAIREDYERRCLAYHKIGVVYVTSAEELSDTQKENIRQKLLATTDFVSLQIHYQVDDRRTQDPDWRPCCRQQHPEQAETDERQPDACVFILKRTYAAERITGRKICSRILGRE